MFILDALRCILCCGQDEQEQDFYSYRNNGDYSSLSPPILRSRLPPPDHLYRDESRVLPPAWSIVDSRGKLKLLDVTSSHGDGNRTIFSNFSSPAFSSSVRDPSTPAPSSSKRSFAQISSTNSNISEAILSIGPEKFQITKNSATCSPEKLYTASQPSKFPYSPISLSTAPVSLSQKPSSSSSSAAPAPSSKQPALASVSSTINKNFAVGIPTGPEKLQISPERPGVAALLSQCASLYTSSLEKDSISPATQSKASSSKKASLATVSSANSSSSKAPVRVWQEKLPIPPDSSTKLAEKPSSSSPSLPSSKKNDISLAPPSSPPLVHISTANNSISLQKNKQTSVEPSRKSVQNIPNLSPALIKIVNPKSNLLSNASSPSSSLESGISNLRVLPKYEIPTYLEEMIRNDIVPQVLMRPLSSSAYGDFFAALLYAEDYYVEKWNNYMLEGITLELRSRISSANSQEMMRKQKNAMLVQRDFVAFEINSIPERRPYLLSRDFVFLKPLTENVRPFKGRLYRVVNSTIILVEFGEDFHSQHSPSKRYDVSFSFNRVCLKRAHHAISVASDSSFHSILFPDQSVSFHPKTFHLHENVIQFEDHVKRILNHEGPIPYLVNGQLVKEKPSDTNFSFTGHIIQVALFNIYKTNPGCRILVCSPTNCTSDLLLRSLRKEIPVSRLFRANAAYRDYDLVPDDIIPASLYEEEEERFTCPPLAELLNFNIIACTFMSSFRLYAAGIDSRHFTHIFLVDTSLATEPEAIVPLAHLADKNTVIVVTGCSNKSPSWVRSDIARRHGLKMSYFNRLLKREPYKCNDSMFISHLT